VQSGDVYRINVDVDGFKPEEITISLKENILTIQAKMERKAEDGSKFQQEFTRELSLPENVDPTSLKSFLGNDGVLNIEASYKPEVKPKEIPVSRS
jgi:HSP20 family molecular chaperone IbpA